MWELLRCVLLMVAKHTTNNSEMLVLLLHSSKHNSASYKIVRTGAIVRTTIIEHFAALNALPSLDIALNGLLIKV